MSGDVQPRKRKEKRRKRADHEYYIQRIQCLEDEDAGTPPPTLIGPSDHGDNVTIHIHKEGGTGGHWCAKIIFFVLLSVLVGLVGVIILESRGSTDVDTPVASSRWAMIFEGWVDDSLSLHDDHEESHDKGDHEAASHEEDEEHQEEQDDHGDDEEAEQADSEEEISNEGENEEEQEDEDSETGPPGVGEDNYYDDDEREEENDSGTLEEVDDDEAEREIEEDENEDEEDDEAEAELLDVSIEGVSTTAAVNKDDDEEDEENNDVSYEFVGIPGVNDIDDDSDEPLEEIEDDPEIDEMTEDSVDLGEDNEDEVEEEPSSDVKAPKAHSGSQPAIKETRSSGPRGDQGKSTAGPQDITFDNASDFDELMIQEELENWLMRDFDN
uniref:Uncharacterized protein n=1 Tax=Fopius arisanus TaxID=64838 RepID=A0A0C9QGB7_9HYME